MRNVTDAQALNYEKAQVASNAATDIFTDSERNHSSGAQLVASACQGPAKNEVDENDAAVEAGACSGSANFDRCCVLAILRAAYRVARSERQRIQADLDLLVGIARAVEAYIYDPAYALDRAVELGLVAWPEIEIAP